MIRVVAAVVVRAGEVLVCRRSAARAHAGKWEFPGGKMEEGETPEQALRRELREELGIDAVIDARIWHARHRYGSASPLEIEFFAVDSYGGTIADRGHFAEVRWQRLESLRELDFLDADRELVTALVERTRETLAGDTDRGAPASTTGPSRGARRDP